MGIKHTDLRTPFVLIRFVVGAIAVVLGAGCETDVTAPSQTHAVVYHYFRDYNYAINRVFDLKPLGDTLQRGDSIVDAAIFTQTYQTSLGQRAGTFRATLELDPRRPAVDSQFQQVGVAMAKMGVGQYFPVISDRASNGHYVVFKQGQGYGALGAWLRITGQRNGRDTTFEIGSVGDTTRVLLMLRPTEPYYLPDHPAWGHMWRNTYEIPSDFDFEHPDLRIFLGPPGTETSPSNIDYQVNGGPFVTLTGLDQYTRGGNNRPDGVADFRPPTFRRDWNLIVFPSRTPFNTDTVFVYEDGLCHTQPLEIRVPVLYNWVALSQLAFGSKYYFRYGTVDALQ